MYSSLAPQLAVVPEPTSELAVAQYSGSSIAAFTGVVLDATHQLDSQTPSRTWGEGTTVGLGQLAIGITLPAAGSPASGSFGVLLESLSSGQIGRCATRGIVPVVAAGSINCRNLLSICTIAGKLGRFQVAVTGEEIVAQALSDASDGDRLLVRLFGSVSIHA